MFTKSLHAAILTLLLALLTVPLMALSDIAIIANPALDIDSISKNEAARLFLAKVKSTKNGTKPQIFDLPEDSKIKHRFYELLTGKNPGQLHSYRARKLFSGEAYSLPLVLNSPEEILMTVANNKNALAYIPVEATNSSIKVLLILSE